MPTIDAAFDLLASLVSAGIIALTAFGLGRPIVRRLAIVEDEPLAVAVWSLACGLVAAGSVFLALANVGLVDQVLIAALSSLGLLWSFVELACVYLGHANGRVLVAPQNISATALGGPPRGVGLLSVPVGLALVMTLLLALAPPTSRETLSGSLEIPELILLRHGLLAAELEAPATNLAQMWTLWALAIDGPVAANLVHWGVGLLAVLATTLLARVLMPSGSAWLAGGLVLVCPGVQSQLGVPLDDLAVALFAALGLCAMLRIWLSHSSGAWAIAGAIALGACTAIESMGLALVAAVVAIWIGTAWLRRDVVDLPWRAVGTLLMVSALLAFPWILLARTFEMPGQRQTVPSALAHLGPCLCLAASALVVARRLRGLKMLLGVCVACGVLAVLVPWPGRWWTLLAPPAGVAAAWAWHELGRLPRWAGSLASCCLALVVLGPAFSLWPRACDCLAVATACQSRCEYLLAREPTYRAASLVNRISSANDRMLCQDDRMFYFDCQTRRQPGESPLDKTSASDRLAEIGQRARGQGFQFLFLAEPVDDSDRRETQFPQSAAASPSAVDAGSQLGPIGEVIPILEYRFADDNNRCIRYRLLRVAGSRNQIR